MQRQLEVHKAGGRGGVGSALSQVVTHLLLQLHRRPAQPARVQRLGHGGGTGGRLRRGQQGGGVGAAAAGGGGASAQYPRPSPPRPKRKLRRGPTHRA